eukprot:gnl/MRDRNA2_/MRDRNA2_250958_c0_seq1.p1 gnl/MRDRNA2_/MRDRNA2_250958_c0~~gnl/MRDRNA2_/MRDRNA2_250958_c0_seq1.p1  ORF type:complete len:295 (+),score=42.25 gnl/MRDRNA2_/MRDRNA2_250958_c0_seq1:62-886(+)
MLAPLLTESPRWLLWKGRTAEAQQVLRQYCKDEAEVQETIQVALSTGFQPSAFERSMYEMLMQPIRNYRDLLTDPELRYNLIWPAAINVFEELVGIEVSDDYCVQFLQEGGMPSRSMIAMLTTTMIIVKGVVLLFSGLALDKYGRKPVLLVSMVGQTIVLTALAYLFQPGVAWQVIAVVWFSYNLFYAAGLGNVCVVVSAESFPDPKVRAVGISFAYILNRLVAAVLTGIYPWMRGEIGTANIFYSWAAAALIGSILTAVFMTERKGSMLECHH